MDEQDIDGDLETLSLDLCLCGRTPDDPVVQEELRRALALCIHYKFEVTGCLSDVSRAFDAIIDSLEGRAAIDLESVLMDIEEHQGIDPLEIIPQIPPWLQKH